MKTLTAAAIFGGVILAACTSEIPLDRGLPCPCIAGYTCCSGVCVEDFLASHDCEASSSSQTNSDTSSSGDDDDTSTTIPTTTYGSDRLQSIGVDMQTGRPPICSTMFGNTLLWMDESGHIGAAGVAGSSAILAMFELPSGPVSQCSMATDANNLYVSLYEAGSILQLSIASSTGFSHIGDSAIRFGTIAHPTQLAVDDAGVYVVEGDTGKVLKVTKPASGSTPTTTAIGQAAPTARDLVSDKTTLYWLDASGVHSLPKAGGAATLLSATDPGAKALTVGTDDLGGQLFWISPDGVVSLPVTGGNPRLIASTPDKGTYVDANGNASPKVIDQLAVSGSSVFAVEKGDVYRFTGAGILTKSLVLGDARLENTVQFYATASQLVWLEPVAVFVRSPL